MSFFAPESKQILIDWINSIDIDWVISRRRYYGTEIPMWYCTKCSYTFVPEPGRYYQPWREKPPIEGCPKCGNTRFKGEERTFDTWFDSANSEIYILGHLWNKEFFRRKFPCTLRPQGKEIVRNWLYFTLLKAYLLFGKAPFKDIWIHMHIVDERGEKMSKSKGNVIDPQDVLKRYGAEAFRVWTCLEGNITRGDIRCSYKRIQGTSKFLTKLWNIARFVSSFPRATEGYKLAALDRMILSELNKLVEECRSGYDRMDVYVPANAIRAFTWSVFADHYIEAVKPRAYNRGDEFDEELQRGAWCTLHACLETILKLLAPICPFVTEAVWLELYSRESIHLQRFPEKRPEWESALIKLTPKFMDFSTTLWKFKKERGVALSQRLEATVYAPKELEALKGDLVAMHGIRELRFTEPPREERVKAHRLDGDTFIVE